MLANSHFIIAFKASGSLPIFYLSYHTNSIDQSSQNFINLSKKQNQPQKDCHSHNPFLMSVHRIVGIVVLAVADTPFAYLTSSSKHHKAFDAFSALSVQHGALPAIRPATRTARPYIHADLPSKYRPVSHR